jgi:hypothetical protein
MYPPSSLTVLVWLLQICPLLNPSLVQKLAFHVSQPEFVFTPPDR